MSDSHVVQSELDKQNAAFWNEPCGTQLARSIGLTEVTAKSLGRFDDEYFGLYPYLSAYVDDEPLAGKRVLEIGLGYGTLGQRIAERGAIYHGLDIAEEPVGLMRMRLALLGIDDEAQARVQQGSALDLPFADASFDYVYTIGCLHHTGDVARGVEEVRRVLKPGGRAVVMLYHKHSFRQLVLVPRARLRTALRRNGRPLAERVRAMYDTNEAGDAAPHTDFVSRREVRRLFQGFQGVEVRARNFETYVLLRGRIVVRRERLLGNVDRLLGLDLYVVADR